MAIRASDRHRSESGFTLVEVLVCLVLSTVAMVGVLALFRAQTNASSFSRRTTEATILAEDQLERLRTQTGAVATTTIAGYDETGKIVSGGPFTRQHTVTLGAGGTYFDVVVSVSWIEEGATRTVTLRGRRNL